MAFAWPHQPQPTPRILCRAGGDGDGAWQPCSRPDAVDAPPVVPPDSVATSDRPSSNGIAAVVAVANTAAPIAATSDSVESDEADRRTH